MKLFLFIFFFFSSTLFFGQKTLPTVGAGLGIGSMFGNFPNQTNLGGKFFFESRSPFTLFDRIQYSITFAQKIEKFIPGSFNYDHYSYYTSFGISGMFNQKLSSNYFIEEGLGFIYLNDRSFDDIDSWNIGILLNLSAGMNISRDMEITFNIDYGITLNKTNVSYVLIFVGWNYNF